MIISKKLLTKGVVHGFLEAREIQVRPRKISKENIEKLLSLLNQFWSLNLKKENLVFSNQLHTANILVLKENRVFQAPPGTDGLISNKKGQILFIETADCLPVLFYNPKGPQVGIAHAGRKGLIQGILKNMIAKMDANPSDIKVAIGPHIRKCCYEIGRTSYDVEKLNLPQSWKVYLSERNKKIYLNLTQAAVDQLTGEGVKRNNINDIGICTLCDSEKRFSSARRFNKEKKRHFNFLSFVGLV